MILTIETYESIKRIRRRNVEANDITQITALINTVISLGPVGWILGGLVALGEILPFIKKTEANGVLHLLTKVIKKK